MEETSGTIIHKSEKPNSYEFGKASNRYKLYFSDAADLKKLIDELRMSGFVVDEQNGVC